MDIQRIINLVKETKGIISNREMVTHVREKGVADYVTQVDIAVQDFLKKALYALAVYRRGDRATADGCRQLLDS